MNVSHKRAACLATSKISWVATASVILSAAGCGGSDGGPQPLPTSTATAAATPSATAAPTATPASIATPLATQPGVLYSQVRIRALQTRATTGQVRVFFTGTLDAASVQSAPFLVTVNGSSFEATRKSYDMASRSVLLQLSQGAFKVGDTIRVAVYSAKDQAGLALFDQQSAPIAAL